MSKNKDLEFAKIFIEGLVVPTECYEVTEEGRKAIAKGEKNG